MFLNFPVMDMHMNVFWHHSEGVRDQDIKRMNLFWGDESWKDVVYQPEPQQQLFGPPEKAKADIKIIAEAFRQRLRTAAGFAYVPEALPMRNTKGAIVYYLFFASPNRTGEKIAKQIFAKHRGASH